MSVITGEPDKFAERVIDSYLAREFLPIRGDLLKT